MDFIQYRPIRITAQEATGVVTGKLPLVQILERHVGLVRKCLPDQGGLSRLARASNRNDRIFPGQLQQGGFGLSRNQHGRDSLAPTWLIVKSFYNRPTDP